MILLASGCTPLYNNNGWSVWGWSREKNNSTVHAGFVSTDFFFGNAGDNTQTTKEKVKIEKQLQDELGFGTIGIYTGKEF
jgi:hypothetical protein